ncbi:MAG: tRNA 2-thiouridine(34) synthase MnmA, partial [Syntrophales bacterium]
ADMCGKRVLVAMSGGVDSSVAAFLLKEAGYRVAGVTMYLAGEPSGRGASGHVTADAVRDAKRVCEELGIRHHVFDYTDELERWVIGPFLREYARGRTPNPCILCNRHLKFGSLLARMRGWGFDALATGHYAIIEKRGSRYSLIRHGDRRKDQTYFLSRIEPEALRWILFPLGPYTKEEVRAIADRSGLPVAAKAESQDVCFVYGGTYHDFLRERMGEQKGGRMVNRKGHCLGNHKGIVCYTVGQRGGLGISHPVPLYVLRIDADKNEIVVGERGELLERELIAGDLNLFRSEWPETVQAKIRYRRQASPCRVSSLGASRLRVRFQEEQEAITPGQSVVFYDGDEVLGGGIIEEVVHGDRG